MLMILARLVRSESFWAVAKVRSPHTGPGIRYIIIVRYARPWQHTHSSGLPMITAIAHDFISKKR